MKYRRIRLGQLGNDPVIGFAVQELARCLKQMDPGLLLDVLRTDRVVEAFSNIIWVGLDDTFQDCIPSVENRRLDDAIAVSVENSHGCITGSNRRSVLIAAYRFLKALGCDWVRPGPEGERIPAKTIDSVCVQIREKASYRHRGVCLEGANSYENVRDMIDYLPKVGMNEYYVQFMTPMTFFKRFHGSARNPLKVPEPITREEVDAMTVSLEAEIALRGICYHKTGHGWTCEPFGISGTGWDKVDSENLEERIVQYLAQVNGKREFWGNTPLNTNLCYSNPEVRNIVTDAITRYCRENPHVEVLHFWLADGVNNHCECEACSKQRPSDWYAAMLNELDEKMTAAGLSTRIAFLLYNDLLWTPEHTKIRNQERFVLMFAPITRIYGQNYADHLTFDGTLPPYRRNQLEAPKALNENLAHLRNWQKVFSGDSFIFDYHLMWAHAVDPGYEFCARNLFEDMKDLDRIGINGMVSCQVQRCAFPTGLPLHMMACALWDKTCDFDKTVAAYYQSAFGADGALVHEYLAELSRLFRVYESAVGGYDTFDMDPMCLSYEAVDTAIQRILPVIERNLQGPLAAEWNKLQIHMEYTTLFARALRGLEAGDMEQVRTYGLQLGEFINRSEILLQGQLDGYNTHRVVLRRLGLKDDMIPEIRKKATT